MPRRSPKSTPPAQRDIRDMLMYRIARLATIGDRTGQLRISRQFAMNVGDWRVFGAIHALAPVTLAGLAQELYIDKGQLSRTVSSLIDEGLVAHRASEQDRRQTLYEPTSVGRRRHARVLAFIVGRNSELLSALDAREQATFFRLLDKVTETAARSYEEIFGPQTRQAPAPDRVRKRASARAAPAREKDGKYVEHAGVRATGA